MELPFLGLSRLESELLELSLVVLAHQVDVGPFRLQRFPQALIPQTPEQIFRLNFRTLKS